MLNHMVMQIKLLLTGGTIDKVYNEISGELTFDKSHIDDMLKMSRITLDVSINEVMRKDSLNMTETDRERIADACKGSEEKRIIILHGTDTMPETARFIETYKLTDKVIILTGAMVPYSFGVSSDAMFNLGSAFAYAQSLLPGVYVAMNGRCFKASEVRKDLSIGRFAKINKS
jgi:L-asparaginase